jgi:hypothetical protein
VGGLNSKIYPPKALATKVHLKERWVRYQQTTEEVSTPNPCEGQPNQSCQTLSSAQRQYFHKPRVERQPDEPITV